MAKEILLTAVHHGGKNYGPGDEEAFFEAEGLTKDHLTRLRNAGAIGQAPDEKAPSEHAKAGRGASRRGRKPSGE